MVDEVAGGGGGGGGAPQFVPVEELGAGPQVAGEVAAGPAVVRGGEARFVPIAHTPESQAAATTSRERLPLTGLDVLLLALGGAMLLGIGMGVRSLSRSLA